MLYPSAKDWEHWGIEDECHRFFALHWTELFDSETPDTWQVRTCNIKAIMREIVEAARVAEDREGYRVVLRSLLDEAFEVSKRDAILEKYHPFVSAYLETWRKREIGQSDVSELERLASVVLGNLDGYWDNGVALVLDLLRRADPQRKKDLYNAGMNLGIEMVGRGHSPDYIRQTFVRDVLAKSESSFPDRVEAMFGRVAKGEAKYSCLFVTSGIKRQFVDSLPKGVRLEYGRPADVPRGPAEQFFKHVSKYGVYLRIDVAAADPVAARHIAEQRIGQVFAGLNLFSTDDHFGQKQADVLVEDEAGAQTLVAGGRPGSHHLGSYEARQTKSGMLFRVQEQAGAADTAQLFAAVQYHRLALLATSDEARLVNLWIALEALCQGGSGSIIERVCTRVAPCVSIDNVRKTIVCLAQYVRFLWQEADRQDFLKLFPGSSDDRLDPEDLVRVLLLPEDDPKLTELCRLCVRHPLILHRLYRARTMMLDCPKAVAANLEYTRRNVEWQLKRIYRLRNAIVHSGRGTALLPQLTQHLHSYLVKTIRSVLFDLDRQPRWTIRDSLEHRRKLFEHVVQFFSRTAGDKISLKTIMQPGSCMSPQLSPYAWPQAETAIEDGSRD